MPAHTQRRPTRLLAQPRRTRRPPGQRLAAALLAAWALCAAPARAHDFWIVPAHFAPHPGEVLAVHLRVGDHAQGEPVPRSEERIVAFVLTGTAAEAAPAVRVVGRDGALPAGLVRLTQVGPQVLGYRSNRAWLELEAPRFEAYLQEEGLDAVLAARAAAGTSGAPGHEVYSRCAKALLCVRGDEAAPMDAPPDRLLGFPLELLAESDPQTLSRRTPAGAVEVAPFRVRLLHDGVPLAGALVKASLILTGLGPDATPETAPVLAFGAPAGIGLHARTDAEGRVSLPLTCPGTWLVTAVHMVPAPPGTQADVAPAVSDAAPAPTTADWESLWASLSFEVLAPLAPQ